MKYRSGIKVLFYLAALYDGVLGIAFLVAGPAIFQWYNVEPPNHFGYLHFSAALLITFALLFLAVALRPESNRNLVPFGMLLKVSYCSVAFYHWLATGIPDKWKPFAIIDLAFLAAFVWAYRVIPKR